jgi:membrane-associated phospholipid phosphatase
MKKNIVLCGILALAFNGYAESKYTYDLTTDLITGSSALGVSIAPFFISHSANSASRNAPFHMAKVNDFDRPLMFAYNKPLDILGDIGGYGLALTPLFSLWGNRREAKAWISYGIMYAESLLLVYGTSEILKNAIPRYRPYCYFGDIPPGKDTDYYKSFPSRHTAFAFMSAGFLTSTFSAEYPESPLKVPLSAAAYTLAAGIGASRIFSGNHFLTDNLSGAALGTLFVYLIPWLHLQKNQTSLTLSPLPNGLLLGWRF